MIEKDKPITEAELDAFIQEAENRTENDVYWITEFAEEAACVGKEMKMWKTRAKALGTDLAKERYQKCPACAMDRPLRCKNHGGGA